MDYDFIIILCAAAANVEGKFPNFLNGMYLGGEVRIKAAAKLLDIYPETNFIVAGGFNEKNIGIAGTSKKVDDIVDFLKDENRKASVQEIYSLPCTHHNFVAVFNYWKSNKIYPHNIGILTNEYHLPRALKFADLNAQSILPDRNLSFTPIAAESFYTAMVHELSLADERAAYLKRQEHEKAGLEKINAGDYTDYCLTRDFGLLKDLIYENPDYLLTGNEKLALNLS